MIIKQEDRTTLTIEPESSAEMVMLESFSGGSVSLEQPKPFQPCIVKLVIKKATAAAEDVI